MLSLHVMMPSRLIPAVLRLKKANKNYLTREAALQHLHDLVINPRPCNPPRRLRRDVAVDARLRNGWRWYSLMPPAGGATGTVIYLHGGGWVHEAAAAHWHLAAQIAAEAHVRVLLPAYPLVQEGGRAEPVVQEVLDVWSAESPSPILVGDSAGAQIALSVSLLLAQAQRQVPLTVLISPPIDVEMTNPQAAVVQDVDPWLCREGLLVYAEKWLSPHSFDHPVLNPVNASPKGLGPLLIFSGTRDILNPDTREFVAKARGAGVTVEYHEGPELVHVYPLTPTPEGKAARARIVEAVAAAARNQDPVTG